MTDQVTGVAAPDAGVQPAVVENQPQGGQAPGVQPQEAETRQVPLSALMGVRDELKTYKEKSQSLESQIQQLRMQQQFYQQPAQPQVPEKQQNEDLLNALEDLSDDDLIDKKTVARVVKGLQDRISQPQDNREIEGLKFELAKVQLASKDKNYEATIKEYLPEIATQNPAIEQTLRAMPTRSQQLMAAYSFAIMNPRYRQATGQETQNPQPSLLEQLDRILENQGKPKNPALATGGGSMIDGADRIATMSDAEFRAFKERVKAGGR